MKTLRNLLGTSIVIAALGLVPAFAQSTMRVTADIPFAFSAGNQSLPAGQYTFVADGNSAVARLQDQAGKTSVVFMTNPDTGSGTVKEAVLKFNRYGNKSYLAGVWSAVGDSGRILPKTAGEKEAAKSGETREVAFVRAGHQ